MAHDIDHLITNIVQTQKIAEQSELQQKLQAKGYEVPQATLSRRLKKLNIAKIAGYYQTVTYNQIGSPTVLRLQISDYGLIVLHTQPGHASSVAYYFDCKYLMPHSQASSGILGSIAGDDTVLLIVKSQTDLENVRNLLLEEFPYLTIE